MIMSLLVYQNEPHNLPQGHRVNCFTVSNIFVKFPDGKGMKISD